MAVYPNAGGTTAQPDTRRWVQRASAIGETAWTQDGHSDDRRGMRALDLVAVKELSLRYHNPKTLLFGIYPYYGN